MRGILAGTIAIVPQGQASSSWFLLGGALQKLFWNVHLTTPNFLLGDQYEDRRGTPIRVLKNVTVDCLIDLRKANPDRFLPD